MQESFDNKLSNKIRNVFDNYYEPVNPNDWELMKEKLANKSNKRTIWLNNIAKAASIVLIVGISVMIPGKLNNYLKNDSKIKSEEKISRGSKNILISEENNSKNDEINKADKYTNTLDNIFKDEIVRNEENNIESYDLISKDTVKNKEVEEIIALNIIKNDSTEQQNIDSLRNISIAKRDTLQKINQKQILLVDDDFFLRKEKKKKKNKRFNVGVAFSTHYNYSDQIASNQVNLGGGLLSEFKITERLSINSGLLISKHGLAKNSLEQKDMAVYSDTQSSISDMNYDNQEGQSEIKKATFIGIDIPLNLQYNFNRFFVSAGVSSLVYLKENYQKENTFAVYNERFDSYTNEMTYDKYEVSQTKEETYGAFQTFDFAKLLNISLGYKIPLKRGKIVFEPYIKIPMGDLATKNISFGFGGISLKYNFR